MKSYALKAITILLSLAVAGQAVANSRSNNPNANDLAEEIVGIIGQQGMSSDQATAVTWFKANYESIYKTEITLKVLNECHANAQNNSAMIECAWKGSRRAFALGWSTFVQAEALVNTLPSGDPKKSALLEHLNKSKNAWIEMVPKACTLESHQMLGGTGSYLLLYGCFGKEAKDVREDLLKAMGIVHRMKDQTVDPLVDARLAEFNEPGFSEGLSTNVGAEWGFQNFREKYNKLLDDSSDYIDVSQYRDLPDQYEKTWNAFRVEYCNGYGSLIGMYAESLKKGNPYSTIPTASAYCNSEKSQAQSNNLYQMAVQIGGL